MSVVDADVPGRAGVTLPPPPARFADCTEVSDPARLAPSPLVSVVVVTYRHAEVLAQCVESIAAQDAPFGFEIVVAEDSSPDATRAVALDLQRRHPDLVRVVFTPRNKGATTNSVLGIALCRGAFIAVCDGDDFWIDPGKLARQAAALARHPQVDMAFSRGFRLYPDGTRVPDWDYGPDERIVPAPELFAGLGWIAPPASLFFRAEILRSLPPWFENTKFGDFQVILAGSVRGGAFYDPRPTICYRLDHPSSFTVALDNASADERERFLRDAIRTLRIACGHYGFPVRHIAARLNDYRLSLGKLLWSRGRKGEAIRTLLGLDPRFLAAGAWRRLRRSTGAGQASSER